MFDYYYNDVGLILEPRIRPSKILIKEPRPIFHEEMKFYHLDDVFDFEESDAPYFWADGTSWIYRGRKIGKLKIKDYYPEQAYFEVSPDFSDRKLIACDLEELNRLNKNAIEELRAETVARIRKSYDPETFYYVSFSGGKDSVALLEIVDEAIHGKYVVVWGNTQMEFPDTYEFVDQIEKVCASRNIKFYRAQSRLEVFESWRLFAPPSRRQRWCCSVHKSTPVRILSRELAKGYKHSCSFIGVRRCESFLRRDRPIEVDEKDSKVVGEKKFNAIVDWTSAEVWLYLFSKHALINKAYRKGFKRVGCLVCPMSGER